MLASAESIHRSRSIGLGCEVANLSLSDRAKRLSDLKRVRNLSLRLKSPKKPPNIIYHQILMIQPNTGLISPKLLSWTLKIKICMSNLII